MKTMKNFCEITFGRIARWSFRHRWSAIALVLAIFLPLNSQIPKLTTDMSNESFFRPDDKVLIDYNEFRNQFGKDEFIVVAIKGSDIFSQDFLTGLRSLHQDIKDNVPFLDKVTSPGQCQEHQGRGR